MKKKLYAAVAAAALAVVPASAAMADAHEDAEVIIVHGVPGFTADILVDGDAAFEGVEFGTIAPAELPAGTYDLAVADSDTGEVALSADGVELAAGTSYYAVAGLNTDGEAELFLGANTTDEGEGIQVAHFANFGNVDITPTDVTGLADVPNGAVGFAATGAATVEGLGVAAAGADENAIDLDPVTVPEGEAVLVFALGPDEGAELPSLEVTTISVDVADDDAAEDDAADDEEMEEPTEEHSPGEAGLAASGLPGFVLALMAAGALLLAVPAVATARKRR